jgi:hypothetical protein
MAQKAVFTNDAQTLQQPIAAPTISLDWARVAQKAGCPSANQIFTNPFQPLNTCSSVPEVHFAQLQPAQLQPVPVHPTEVHPAAVQPVEVHPVAVQPVAPTPEETHHHGFFKDWHAIKEEFSTTGYLMNDSWFGLLRNGTYAGSFIAKGKLSQLPFKDWKGVGTIFSAEMADNILDATTFKGVKRGLPSTVTDLAANAIFFLPQSGTVRAAEMIGMHVLGKEIEKYYHQKAQAA